VEKRKSGKIGTKEPIDHWEGERLWRAKPKSVGDWKRSPRIWVAYTVERVAKPWGRYFRGIPQVPRTLSERKVKKKGPRIRKCC